MDRPKPGVIPAGEADAQALLTNVKSLPAGIGAKAVTFRLQPPAYVIRWWDRSASAFPSYAGFTPIRRYGGSGFSLGALVEFDPTPAENESAL